MSNFLVLLRPVSKVSPLLITPEENAEIYESLSGGVDAELSSLSGISCDDETQERCGYHLLSSGVTIIL